MGILCSPAPAQAGYRALLQAAVGTAYGYSPSLTQGIPQGGASLTLCCAAGSYPYVLTEPFPLPLPTSPSLVAPWHPVCSPTKLAIEWHCIVPGGGFSTLILNQRSN